MSDESDSDEELDEETADENNKDPHNTSNMLAWKPSDIEKVRGALGSLNRSRRRDDHLLEEGVLVETAACGNNNKH
jgi:hypothetical protein